MIKVDKPQYTVDHDGNYLFLIHIEGSEDFSATVDVRMEGMCCRILNPEIFIPTICGVFHKKELILNPQKIHRIGLH